MPVTLTKVKRPSVNNALEEFAALNEEGLQVGIVYKRTTSKTGFKNGRTVGQVRVAGWFFRLLPSHPYDEFGMSEGMAGGPKWKKKDQAVEALEAELRERSR